MDLWGRRGYRRHSCPYLRPRGSGGLPRRSHAGLARFRGDHVQGTPLVDLSLDDFARPVTNYARTHFLTARAAARHMVETGSGVILMMTTTLDRRAIPLVAAELGPCGVRVVCLRSTGSPESPGVREAFAHHAEAAGGTPEEFQASLERGTMLRRLTTLDEVAAMTAFIASDRASATTGTAVNLTCGSVID